VLLYYTKFNLA